MDNKTIEYYLGLPYKTEIIQDLDPDNPGWVVRVVDLPGCITQADTFVELEEMIADAKRVWIESALEDGDAIPEPRKNEDYSGKFVARVPKFLHRKLVETAEQEGVSLNQYVSTVLAEAVGEQLIRQRSVTQETTTQKNVSLEKALERLCQVAGIENVRGSIAEKAYADRMVQQLTQCFNGNPEDVKYELYSLEREILLNANSSPLLMLQADLLGKLKQLVEKTSAKPRVRKLEQNYSIPIPHQNEQAAFAVQSRLVAEIRPEYKRK
ncbi:MAG: toxin-antitoxin system HicB family antitoxin [Chloroflexota bacterium]